MDVWKWTRFRLRSLLLAVLITSLLLAWLHDHRRQARNVQDTIDASSQHFGPANVRAAIIDHAAVSAGLSLSDDDVEREVMRTAEKVGMETDRWYRLIEHEAGLTPPEYRTQLIRPALQLRGLRDRHPTACDRLKTEIESRFPELPALPLE